MFYLPYGFLAIIGSSISKGSDSPSLLTAVTRNLYFFNGVKPLTSNAAKTNDRNYDEAESRVTYRPIGDMNVSGGYFKNKIINEYSQLL